MKSFVLALLSAAIFCLVDCILADCPKTSLYCFDSIEKYQGEIKVDQCWYWARLSCQPCSVKSLEKQLNFHSYIHHCRYFYPKSEKVFETKRLLAHRFNNIKSQISYG